jgi:predicted RNase H-like nuclease (RuvC/YqgF family)
MMVEGQERVYDLTQGNYAVTVTTGASYATMRQEAAEFFERVIMSQPQLMNIMGDLLFKYSDFPGAQAMSERMKKLIDPNILDEEADPQVMALQAQNEELQGNMQILQAEIGNLQKALQDKQQEIEIKAQSEIFDAEADKRRHQIEVAKLQLEEQKITVELSLKKQELDLKIAEAIQKQENKDRDDIKEVILQVDELGNFI